MMMAHDLPLNGARELNTLQEHTRARELNTLQEHTGKGGRRKEGGGEGVEMSGGTATEGWK